MDKDSPDSNMFTDISYSAQAHFRLYFYAAIFRLLNYFRRLGEFGNHNLETIKAEYPFLKYYQDVIDPYLPADMEWEKIFIWWKEQILAWQNSCTVHLPLASLGKISGLGFDELVILIFTGLVEEDSRFGTVFADLQAPITSRRPNLELLKQILISPENPEGLNIWQVCQTLLSAGLIDVANQDLPQTEWTPYIPPILWDVIRGEPELVSSDWFQYHPADTFPALEDLVYQESFVSKAIRIPDLLCNDNIQTMIIRGTQGSDGLQVVGAIARNLKMNVIEIANGTNLSDTNWRHLGALCMLHQTIPVIRFDLAPGETAALPQFFSYQGPIAILMGFEGGFSGLFADKTLTLSLPVLDTPQRQKRWEQALAGHSVDDIETISERFCLPGDYIQKTATIAIAHATLAGRKSVCIEDVREACRSLNRQVLDKLAIPLEVDGSWDQLVVNPATTKKLLELEQRCRQRENLLEHLNPAFHKDVNRGVRALFSGDSGTGKTLAAKILAAELGMDLYRVDPAAIVNKYVGETEKNLHQILSHTEELPVITLIDEGDWMMSNRTEVRSANDRYANLETNYLLQKLETYQGIILITTNAGENIDKAFQRRMDVVINFSAPGAEERKRIWKLHLPEKHTIDEDFLITVSLRCTLTGGQIRNAALQATLLALTKGSEIKQEHLQAALKCEYQKAGSVYPISDEVSAIKNPNGIKTFWNVST